MATLTRPGVALPRPAGLGNLLASETPADRSARLGTVYERTVAPPVAFLTWLLKNPARMLVRDPINFGAKSVEAQQWRSKLFSTDESLVTAAQEERLNQLVNEAIASPEIHKRLTDEFALNSRPLTLEQCAQQDRDERAKWAEYVKIARIEPQ
jgi:hypothetical protein